MNFSVVTPAPNESVEKSQLIDFYLHISLLLSFSCVLQNWTEVTVETFAGLLPYDTIKAFALEHSKLVIVLANTDNISPEFERYIPSL